MSSWFKKSRSVGGVAFFLVLLCFSPFVVQAASPEEDAALYFEEGKSLNEERLFNEAIIQFANAVNLSINTHKYHRALHSTYIATRRGRQGVRYYKKLVRTYPGNAVVHYWLGRFYLSSRETDKARQEFAKSAQIDPTDEHALISLGHAASRLDLFDEALKAYKAADVLFPDIPVVKVGIGNIYFKQKKYPLAAEAYKVALDKDGSFLEARYNLGVIYEKMGEHGEAAEQWQKMLDEDPNESQARQRLAELYFRAKLYVEAVREYATLSVVKLEDPKIFLALGESQVLLAAALLDTNDRKILQKRAIDSFVRVLELRPENQKAKDYLTALRKVKIPEAKD